MAVRAHRADLRARAAGALARLVGARVSRRCRVREPAPDYSTPPVRAAEPAVGVRAGERRPCVPGRADGAAATALPWPNARRCATAIAGSATDRDCAAGRATKGRRPKAAAAACISCQPVRSLRAIRGRFVAACALLAAGGAVHSAERRLARPRDRARAAGAAARAAAGAQRRRRPNCAACHAAAERSVARLDGVACRWLTAIEPTQSQLCMDCHDEDDFDGAGANGAQSAG